ncbi:tyrosine--tRNA ligase [Candidatus Saccharibacteria bacterium]|nr:tyrosine--tRNA ligase [Candidatus Saccharibacteria bacterium]
MTNLTDELAWRGFKNQTTLKDLSVLDNQKITFYWGVDPSSDSMHIGHLAMAIMVRHFINAGHQPILLVGGATGLIGDPDGKTEERELKTVEEINHNKQAIVAQYHKIFDGVDFAVVDNYDWFKEIKFVDFLRDYGKNFSLTQLLDRDFVKSRTGEGGSGISYAEFSYSLIQGYDFLHLFREKGVTLQVAGSDQWGNSLSGVELIRKVEGKEAHVYTAPLIINKTTGKKFGKTEEGAVWLDEKKTSVYQFYQFWLNIDDNEAIDYLKIYTDLSRDQIERLGRESVSSPSERAAQKALAFEVTKLVHGRERAENVQKVTEVLFGDNSSVSQLDQNQLELLSGEIPTASFGNVGDRLVEAGLVSSKGEFRRLLEGGAITINGQRASEDSDVSEISLIKKGKNSFLLVR